MTYVKEVILENFMSYEYARIPLSRGLNIITGPNGAGKSTILLGISIAMGQSHTERGRRLSDLIRIGRDVARVSIVLDNREVDGRRPFPGIRSDEVVFTRIIRGDGNYLYEVNYRASSKAEVRYLLGSVGINPDNILIIMHQNMIESFNFIDSREKVKLFEEALGISGLRSRIVEARERLARIASEEEAVRRRFRDVESLMEKWREMYRRWEEKRGLINELSRLEAMYAWGRVRNMEAELNSLRDLESRLRDEKAGLEEEVSRLRLSLRELEEDLKHLYAVVRDSFRDPGGNPGLIDELIGRIDGLRLRYGDLRASEAVKTYRIEVLERELHELGERIRRAEGEARLLRMEASRYPEIYPEKPLSEILGEIRAVKKMLEKYGDVDETAAASYEYYRRLYEEYRERLEEIVENRDRLYKELERRVKRWREELEKYVSRVSDEFNRILARFGATGYARLEDTEDIETARLEIYVGYGGATPTLLDAYRQSGGERTVAAMAFLLAMQRLVKSPFRAVDEFDVHMDPRNRARVMELLMEYMSSVGGQYLVITPGYIGDYVRDAHVIVVQKVEGRSGVALYSE